MIKEDILNEVNTGAWQPEFEFTDNLDAVVDSILKPHEDYFLGLHSKVKEIIEREVRYIIGNRIYDENTEHQITFADVCNWQKELFEYKRELIDKIISPTDFYNLATDEEFDRQRKFKSKVANLPNQHINLGLRTTNVKVGNWNPPHPMFLNDLLEMSFPITISIDEAGQNWLTFGENNLKGDVEFYKKYITQWYKVFNTIHFLNDLNGRIGGIIVNILSYILTGKFLIKKEV